MNVTTDLVHPVVLIKVGMAHTPDGACSLPLPAGSIAAARGRGLQCDDCVCFRAARIENAGTQLVGTVVSVMAIRCDETGEAKWIPGSFLTSTRYFHLTSRKYVPLFLLLSRLQICYDQCATKLPGFKYFGTQYAKEVRSTLPV